MVQSTVKHLRLIWQNFEARIRLYLESFKIPIYTIFRRINQRILLFDFLLICKTWEMHILYVMLCYAILCYAIEFNQCLYGQSYPDIRTSYQVKFLLARHMGCLHIGRAIYRISKAYEILNPGQAIQIGKHTNFDLTAKHSP